MLCLIVANVPSSILVVVFKTKCLPQQFPGLLLKRVATEETVNVEELKKHQRSESSERRWDSLHHRMDVLPSRCSRSFSSSAAPAGLPRRHAVRCVAGNQSGESRVEGVDLRDSTSCRCGDEERPFQTSLHPGGPMCSSQDPH